MLAPDATAEEALEIMVAPVLQPGKRNRPGEAGDDREIDRTLLGQSFMCCSWRPE